MMKRITTVAAASMVVVLCGCATPTKMAFQDDSERITEKSKPILLMTATIKNEYKPSFQPQLRVVNVEKPEAKEAADRFNFTMDDKVRKDGDPEGNYLLRLELDPGHYELRGMTALVRSFPITGFFFAPLHSTLDVKGPGVYYLGHINAIVRERQGEEFKAGPSVPLIDQALVGASGGTFDIVITDDFAADEAVFRSRFPALTGVTIQKAVLPAFDRAKAQAWWEAH
jgi:hypothetical protein